MEGDLRSVTRQRLALGGGDPAQRMPGAFEGRAPLAPGRLAPLQPDPRAEPAAGDGQHLPEAGGRQRRADDGGPEGGLREPFGRV